MSRRIGFDPGRAGGVFCRCAFGTGGSSADHLQPSPASLG